ncbi:MAG TPA: ATP-binding protein [Bryobacteraceae bacterium]|nr:ATP-binding protein [Bryobacteraceae bacterium]
MGARIRAFDWSAHPLGAPDKWPQSLKTAVSLILNSQHPMWIGWGEQISFLYNDAYLHVLGLAKHPWALGRPAQEVWSEIWNVCGPLAEKVFREGQASFVDEVRLFMNRGDFLEETYYSFSYSPIRDESGSVQGLFCPSNDVTPKVLNARRLRTLSELSGNSLVERTTDAACATFASTLAKNPDDTPFALLYLVNAAGTLAVLKESVRVINPESLTPASIDLTQLNNGDTWWPVAQVFLSGLPQRVSVRGSEAFPRGAADQPVSEAMVLPVVSRLHDKPLGILIAGVNPTRRPDAEYQTFFELVAGQLGTAIQNARSVEDERRRADMLAEIDRAKTTFFSNVSHEFRTPLTLMLGPIETLLDDPSALSPAAREQVVTAHRNSLRLLKLVNSLLDFSRIEAGRVKALYQPVDLATITRDLASNFRSAMHAGGLELVVNCAPLSQPVYIDREMWEKIVLNLLSNAFKYTFEGQVTVTLEERDNQAVLTVADTGVGIPESELPHIFERFHRVEGTRGRTYEGTGIGLALIQELVRLHGGTTEVESVLSKGSTFTVSLPFGSAHLPHDRIGAPDTAPAATSLRAEAYTQEAEMWVARDRLANPSDELPDELATGAGLEHRPRILLADDNADMREHIAHTLGSHYRIEAVADGLAALDAARRSKPDLVLSDVMMPRLDGFGLLAELRRDPELRELPVLLLSARAGEEARTEGIAAGADDYITKPFSAKELMARVQTALELQQVRREARAQFEMLLNTAPMGVYLVDADFRIRQVNPTARPLFGNIRELIGRDFDEVTHLLWSKENADELVRLFRHTLETGQAYIAPERIENRIDRGTREYYEWRIERIRLPDGHFGVVCYFRDISAQVKAREAVQALNAELRLANEDLEQFAYSASHDLQEPLRSVRIYSELLAAHCRQKLTANELEFLEFLRTGATRMEMLVRDLLAYTQAARVDEPAETADAAEALQTALAGLAGAISESGATVDAQDLPLVRVHHTHLQLIFQNLVGNAIKYRRKGVTPVVHVSAERQNSNWLFAVSDNGIGIEAEYKERIFGLFKRLHTSDEYSGTGIGLAICQRIVERYHGRIWVDSEPGKGSIFYFTLPA